jgi:MoaA/NifB/PqqE/SkfB family radical SAM enzyme
MAKLTSRKNDLITNTLSLLLPLRFSRQLLLQYGEARLTDFLVNKNERPRGVPLQARRDAATVMCNLLRRINIGYERGYISGKYISKFVRPLVLAGAPDEEHDRTFQQRYGMNPPMFLVCAPTQACNLKCEGCYANCDAGHTATMDYDVLVRMLEEKRDSWGSHFTVISGGEPFMYRSRGKTIFDVFARFPDTMFLVYTNGTLIDETAARRLARLGNVTVAISVEGYEEHTDARRGKGTFAKIQRAFTNLRNAGVMFGISLTITRNNVDLITADIDGFHDFYMNRCGATYAWMFQYMPIGRNHDTFHLVITPQQRKKLWQETWRVVREKEAFFIDFWNSGAVSSGCISAGRPDGYLYVDWNGNVMPCVFNPYYTDNLYDIYARGGHLDDALFSPFMKGIRQWQRRYYYNDEAPGKKGNVFTPCVIRDHYDTLYPMLCENDVRCANDEAREALKDAQYRENLITYGRECRRCLDPEWERYTRIKE